MLTFPHPLSHPVCQGFLETGEWGTVGATPLILRGWVFLTSGQPWHQLQVLVGNRLLASTAPQTRPDVGAAFVQFASASASGFSFHLPVMEMTSPLTLRLIGDEGVALDIAQLLPHQLPGRSALLPERPDWVAHRSTSGDESGSAIPLEISFSLVIPVFDPEPAELQACLDSVRSQTHPHWEACLVDDGCRSAEVLAMLDDYAQADPRFRVIRCPENEGIGRATNRGIAAASHPWIGFVDHDDCLLPHALARIAATITEHPATEAIFSDEEKIDVDGTPRTPFLKPGWSPVLLRGVMYVGHFLCVRKDRVLACGGIDPAFDGVQDYEFMLRLTETGAQVRHLPEVLYQWRMGARSSALVGNIKGDMDRKQQQAVAAHLQRIRHPGVAHPLGRHRISIDPPDTFVAPAHIEIAMQDGITATDVSENVHDSTIVILRETSAPGTTLTPDDLRRLVFHASAEPDRVFVPLLVSRDGAVVESGCTLTESGQVVRLMHGFDPAADGMNGSLCCSRQARTTSGLVLAMHVTLWEKLRHATAEASPEHPRISPAILSALFNDVVVLADARATVAQDLSETSRCCGHTAGAEITDPFWNPQFDPSFGDYRLRPHQQNDQKSLVFDFPLPSRTHDPRIRIIGWCLSLDGREIRAARLEVNDWVLPVIVSLPRPDVCAQQPQAGDQSPGFDIRFELPYGQYSLAFSIRREGADSWETIHEQELHIVSEPPLDLAADPGKLVAFQLGIHPKHAPKAAIVPHLSRRSAHRPSPRLSIVTPSFQQGQYIGRTLQSIDENDLHELEHVVQDGGSTDGTVAALEAHEAGHRRWVSAPDRGQAHAIALGFERTAGAPDDLMAWLNADDYYVPGALDFVRDYFATHPDVDALYGNRIVVDSQDREINRWYLPPHDAEAIAINDYVPQETLFWRRRIWNRVGGIDAEFQFALDWDLILRFQSAGARIVHIPEFLACFRVHEEQKTSAKMATTGQWEIDRLRQRTFGRILTPEEVTYSQVVQRYLLASARCEREALDASRGHTPR